ncbi:EAL domain-containing protein [Pseudonocardia nematodicida]|uniref:EAL domain-containing protein n=1 Tax=Pseudonocardia nematodicida TaxID=1206997 RepID=A0ABV1K9A3_9PSEU
MAATPLPRPGDPPRAGAPAPAAPSGDVERLAEAWTAAIVHGGFVSTARAELRRFLTGTAGRVVATVDGDADPGLAAGIGADLVAAHLTDPAALRCSLDVLAEHFADRARTPDGLRRFTAVVGALSDGYARTLQERTRIEQERISAAAFSARGVAEAARWASEARYGAVFAHALIGISVADVDGRILEVNAALSDMLGYDASELLDRSIFDFIHPDDTPDAWPRIQAMTAGEVDHVRLEKAYFRKDGFQIWTELVVTLVRDPGGSPRYLVAMVEDVTERHHLQSRLQHQAEHDPLTGLPNRALFFRHLTAALDALNRVPPDTPAAVGVCYLDLDGFKAVNDTLGHDTGDQLLTTVAHRLERGLSPDGHIVARMGGDEFVVLVDQCAGDDDLAAVAQRALEVVRTPVPLRGRDVVVSASIGIVARPRSGCGDCPAGRCGCGAAELMQAADTTMYWAKRDGRDRVAVFDPRRHRADVALFEMAGRMPSALENGEFELDYQPLVSLSDGRVRGVEALARWRTADGERLGPDVFIPLAEQTGLIVPLGLHLLRRACLDARSWLDGRSGVEADGSREFVLSVNVSGRQLRQPDAVDRIAAVLAETGWPAGSLQLELTESDLMSSGGRPIAALDALARLGVRIAIDDFGTGYSNLSYLHRLPVDVLKLAGSFVSARGTSDAETDTADGRDVDNPVILSAMIDLAHTLGLVAVAESVETAEQAARLRVLGCDVGQGYYLATPVTPAEIPALLDRPVPLG